MSKTISIPNFDLPLSKLQTDLFFETSKLEEDTTIQRNFSTLSNLDINILYHNIKAILAGTMLGQADIDSIVRDIIDSFIMFLDNSKNNTTSSTKSKSPVFHRIGT